MQLNEIAVRYKCGCIRRLAHVPADGVALARQLASKKKCPPCEKKARAAAVPMFLPGFAPEKKECYPD